MWTTDPVLYHKQQSGFAQRLVLLIYPARERLIHSKASNYPAQLKLGTNNNKRKKATLLHNWAGKSHLPYSNRASVKYD